MEATKNYFKREFQKQSVFLEHGSAEDFHLSCWQRNRSYLPMLALRAIILLGCLSILIASMVVTSETISFGLWFIFLTHWGIVLITAVSGFGFAVSLLVALKGPIDSTFGLPWYVKAYWVCYNMAIAIAFFITVFYWVFLTDIAEDYAMDPTLDVFVHAINSVLMLVLILASRHPVRLLHFYWPLLLGIIYMLFSLIFYYAGALSPFGTSYIYPMLDWSKPLLVTLTVLGSTVAIIFMHFLHVAITVGRDALAKRYSDSDVLNIN